MNGVRKLFLVITVFMFVLTLLIVNLVWTVNNTITNREVVMAWINDSGFYDNIVDEVAKLAEEKIDENQNQNQNQNPDQNQNNPSESEIDSALMIRAAKRVFTPEVVKEKLEPVLNGVYDWLEGETPNLQFALDLSQQKAAFAESLGEEARTRAAALPVCTQDQVAISQNADVLTIQCIPPEFEAQVAKFQQEFATSDEFLSDTTITGDDLKAEKNGVQQPITQTISSVPAWYQFAQALIWFMLIASVIWGLLVVFLSKNIRYGLKHLAVAFLIAGIFVAISAVATSQVTQVVKVSDTGQEIALALVKESTKTIVGIEIIIAAIYIALFAGITLYLYLTKSKNTEVVDTPHTDTESTAENTTQTASAPAKPEVPLKKSEDSADKSKVNEKNQPTTRG